MPSVLQRRVKTKDFLTILRNLSVELKAGIPLVRALKLLEENITKRQRRYVTYLRSSVEKGMNLATAMDSSPWAYPPLAISLVRAGELSGTLQQNIEELTNHIRKSQDLHRKIRAAMTYPVFVLVAIMGLGLSVGTFVLPKLLPLFEGLGVKLPFTTRVLMFFANFFNSYGFIVAPLVILGTVAIAFVSRMEFIKPLTHKLFLMIPLIGTIQRKNAIVQITGTLSTLLKSGIPIAQALPSTAKATGNIYFRRAIFDVMPYIQEGHMLADGLRKTSTLFPEMTVTFIEIGESTGTLAATLEFVEHYYEEEVDYAVKSLTTAIEPLLLIVIGVIVAFFVLGVITPLYDVTSSVS